MANQSLARIMYGTSEAHYFPATVASAVPPLSNRSLTETVDTHAEKAETLGTLLHRAWNSLSGKH
jgi:hypothetical protein